MRDCQSTCRAVAFMFNLQSQLTDFGFQVGDFCTDINGNIVGIKYLFEKIKTGRGLVQMSAGFNDNSYELLKLVTTLQWKNPTLYKVDITPWCYWLKVPQSVTCRNTKLKKNIRKLHKEGVGVERYSDLQAHKSDVCSMTQCSKLVDVDQPFWCLLLVVDRKVTKCLCCFHVIRLPCELRQQDL